MNAPGGEDRVQQALARWRALSADDPWREDIEVIYARLQEEEDHHYAAREHAEQLKKRLRAVEGERDRWQETARQYAQNSEHHQTKLAKAKRVWNPNVNDLHEYIEKLERENSVLLTRLRAAEGERDGFRALADDYWNQLCEINHERNLFRDKLAQAEQRVAGLEAVLKLAWRMEPNWRREVERALTPARAEGAGMIRPGAPEGH